MKNGLPSWAVLLTMKPLQNTLPPVEIAAIAGISARHALPCGQTTSTLHGPEASTAGSGSALRPAPKKR